MKKAVISGDIVASTSLNDAGREFIEKAFEEVLGALRKTFGTYSRVLRGDYLECAIPHAEEALRIALAIKSHIKSLPLAKKSLYDTDKRARVFKTYGIRLAIGYGELSRFDPDKGIIDGEAIYLSGRTINEFSTYNKERIVIKNTLFFVSNDDLLNREMEPLLGLLDVLLSKATPKQCQVLYLKLMGFTEEMIATKLKTSQSVVNQHSTSVGWNAIEKSVRYFEEKMKGH